MDLVEIHRGGGGGGYASSDDDSDREDRKRRRHDLAVKEKPKTNGKATREEFVKAYDKEEGSKQRFQQSGMDAYSRHKQVINMYMLYCSGSTAQLRRDTSKDKTDADVIRENHQFLWDEDTPPKSWEQSLAKKYYDKLFKEYTIADLSRYRDNKVALRWRVEKEVVDGKGQFSCGNKHCDLPTGLRTWEVNFAYPEAGERKSALVKLRLCPDCSFKLNYNFQMKEVRKRKPDAAGGTKSAEDKTRTSDASNARPVDAVVTSPEQQASGSQATDDANVWTKAATPADEQTRESQFEEYLQDLLL